MVYKRRDLVDLLSEILGYPKRYSQGQSEVEFNCPHCDRGRDKFNLVVNVDNEVFHCWSCKYKGHATRLVRDFAPEKMGRYNTQSSPLARHFKKDQKDYREDLKISAFRSLKMKWTDSLTYRAAMNYLKSRKITEDHIKQWDICYSEEGKYADRIIVPSRRADGVVEYFIARDIFDTSPLKYKNPRTRKSTCIFGEKFIDWRKPVILTEGVFDAMVMYNAVPLLGTKIEGHDKLLRKIMEHKTPVILGFDEDETGETERIKVAKKLESIGSKLFIITGNDYGDLASAFQARGREYLVELVRNAEPFDELDMKVRLI